MFTGFTPETIDFLWGIRMNNNKEWFTANKKQYTDHLYHPMKELGAEKINGFRGKAGKHRFTSFSYFSIMTFCSRGSRVL